MSDFLDFYARKDIQKAILEASIGREIAVKYANGGFGKRPDILNYEQDVFELAKQGATSFHVSEEHWKNPLLLKPGMTKSELDSLRSGWDLIIDIDTKFIEYSKATALLLVEALKFNEIKNLGLKFSGGSGFHLGIPFSSLPEKVNNILTVKLFPEAPRAIAGYLKEMIRNNLREKILKLSTLKEITLATGKEEKDLIESGLFNPFSIIEIDTILISNRHMYRAPYSINEKKGLVSIPLDIDELRVFNPNKAKMENVKLTKPFLPRGEGNEATYLIMQALDAVSKRPLIVSNETAKTFQHYEELKNSIPEEFFPPCIKQLSEGIKEDGRKRALFILINFLRSAGYTTDQTENILKKWNQKNNKPLPATYIDSQLGWHKRQPEVVLPPNCSNLSYYQELGVKCPEEICSRCKNPLQFAKRMFFAHKKNKPRQKRQKRKSKR